MTPCYNHGVKRLWPLPVLLLLALPLRAQEGDPAPPGTAAEPAAGEDSQAAPEPAAQEEKPAEQEDKPAPADNAPAVETNTSGDQAPQDNAASGDEADKPAGKPRKEESMISVKVVNGDGEAGDEESVAPAAPKKKVVPTATLKKVQKKGKPAKAAKPAKDAKGKKPVADVVKTKAPAVAPEPPSPPVPAVPLTPITPRNP